MFGKRSNRLYGHKSGIRSRYTFIKGYTPPDEGLYIARGHGLSIRTAPTGPVRDCQHQTGNAHATEPE